MIGKLDERVPLPLAAAAENVVLLSGWTPPDGPAGVGGGEPPTLLRSLRVGGREWISRIASTERLGRYIE